MKRYQIKFLTDSGRTYHTGDSYDIFEQAMVEAITIQKTENINKYHYFVIDINTGKIDMVKR